MVSEFIEIGKIVKVAGPLVIASGLTKSRMFDVVRVSELKLIGEIIELRGDRASIQVYEETQGLGPGEPVYCTGHPLSLELGPGLIESIYDGIQRPLDIIRSMEGDYITRGINLPGLSRDKTWNFTPTASVGDEVQGGDIIGTVPETKVVLHRITIPPRVSGRLTELAPEGVYKVTDKIGEVKTFDGNLVPIFLMQSWPVRIGRPFRRKLAPTEPLATGQRVIDMLFPIAKGGTACVPGPFGSGKTVVQHQLAKWADANIIVYIGCGERGNEMTDVLLEFPELEDPQTGEPLMKRTVLVANTSNMPVAAREASIYTGITIAEYFRDMGYDVALMADSTSRWAEAMREISGRLEEMPGEEGYPAYLATKVASFYERAGRIITLGQEERNGSVSAIGAVSPPGGDLSDPVVQSTLKVAKVFWGLDSKLAYRRHFPAINWLNSYSLYLEALTETLNDKINQEWMRNRYKAMEILQLESELEEIVRLVGKDSLSPRDQLVLETAKSIREDFLHQIAFDPQDTYTSLNKQFKMLEIILYLHERMADSLEEDIPLSSLTSLPIKERIARMKYVPEDEIQKIDDIKNQIEIELKELRLKIETGI